METIGWIGTGVMGNRMCRHIIDTEYDTYVYNRTRSKAKSILGDSTQGLYKVFEKMNGMENL